MVTPSADELGLPPDVYGFWRDRKWRLCRGGLCFSMTGQEPPVRPRPSGGLETAPTPTIEMITEYSESSKQFFPARNLKLTVVELLIYSMEDLPLGLPSPLSESPLASIQLPCSGCGSLIFWSKLLGKVPIMRARRRPTPSIISFDSVPHYSLGPSSIPPSWLAAS